MGAAELWNAAGHTPSTASLIRPALAAIAARKKAADMKNEIRAGMLGALRLADVDRASHAGVIDVTEAHNGGKALDIARCARHACAAMAWPMNSTSSEVLNLESGQHL